MQHPRRNSYSSNGRSLMLPLDGFKISIKKNIQEFHLSISEKTLEEAIKFDSENITITQGEIKMMKYF